MAHFFGSRKLFRSAYGFTFYNPDLSTGSGPLDCGHSGTASHDFAATGQRECQEKDGEPTTTRAVPAGRSTCRWGSNQRAGERLDDARSRARLVPRFRSAQAFAADSSQTGPFATRLAGRNFKASEIISEACKVIEAVGRAGKRERDRRRGGRSEPGLRQPRTDRGSSRFSKKTLFDIKDGGRTPTPFIRVRTCTGSRRRWSPAYHHRIFCGYRLSWRSAALRAPPRPASPRWTARPLPMARRRFLFRRRCDPTAPRPSDGAG